MNNSNTLPRFVDGHRVVAGVLDPDQNRCFVVCERTWKGDFVLYTCWAHAAQSQWNAENGVYSLSLAHALGALGTRMGEFQDNAALDSMAASVFPSENAPS